MPRYTIETVRHLIARRHRTYRAATVAEACRQAVEDKDWSAETLDREHAGEPFVAGIWKVADVASSCPPIPIPSHYGETIHRQARHFEILLGLLKMLLADIRAGRPSSGQWIKRTTLAVAQAEAIMAGARDPAELPTPAIKGGDDA